MLVGEKVWTLVGPLSPKDKTQLEERLRRVAGPSSPAKPEHQTPAPPPQVSRLANAGSRPESPSVGKAGGIPRPTSPAASTISRIARPGSPGRSLRSASPAPLQTTGRASSPPRGASKLPNPSGVTVPSATVTSGIPSITSASGLRPKSMLPSRLAQPRSVARPSAHAFSSNAAIRPVEEPSELPYVARTNGSRTTETTPLPSSDTTDTLVDSAPSYDDAPANIANDITITISSILSSDPSRSVDALKKIQKIFMTKPEDGHASPEYRDLAEHTEGLIETITLQMAHVFERQEELLLDENFRLAKHLIQSLNTFCDHTFLAESLTVEILTPLLEELTLRLLETDESNVTKVKDLSRFINMIVLRLFATGRKMSIFRLVFSRVQCDLFVLKTSEVPCLPSFCKSSSPSLAPALHSSRKKHGLLNSFSNACGSLRGIFLRISRSRSWMQSNSFLQWNIFCNLFLPTNGEPERLIRFPVGTCR